jgi:dihydroorotase
LYAISRPRQVRYRRISLLKGIQEVSKQWDSVLRGGTIVDPIEGRFYSSDIAISEGRIVAIEPKIEPSSAKAVINVDGMLICPGFIDVHGHFFYPIPQDGILFADRAGIDQGVTTVIDAGSFGSANADSFYECIVTKARTNVYGFINVKAVGNMDPTFEGLTNSYQQLAPEATIAWIKRADWIRGVKVVADVDIGLVMISKKIAQAASVPLMVHIGYPGPIVDYVCPILEEGDIITHCWHSQFGGILDGSGTVVRPVWEAVENGVLLDTGHGCDMFSFDVAEQALDQGLPLHLISADLHEKSILGPAFSLVKTMTKVLYLGVDLMDVVRAVTLTPARALGLEDRLGGIEEGMVANISILQDVERKEELVDSTGDVRYSDRALVPRYAVCRGEVHQIVNGHQTLEHLRVPAI